MEIPIKKIEADTIYSVSAICKNKLIPHAITMPTVKKIIIKHGLNHATQGEENGKRYYIRGRELIKYLNKFYGDLLN